MDHKADLQQAIEDIQMFRKHLDYRLMNLPNFRQRADNVLMQLQNGFAHVAGIGFAHGESQTTTAGPLRTFLGQPLPEVPVPARMEEPTRTEIDLISEEVDNAYLAFPVLEAGDIRDYYSDLVIRGVAKRAGMKITATEPAKLTNAFLESIKVAIAAKADHDAQVDAAETISSEIKSASTSTATQEVPPAVVDVVTEPDAAAPGAPTETETAPKPDAQSETETSTATAEEAKGKNKGGAAKK